MPILAPVVHPVIFSLRRSNVNRLRPFTLGILTSGNTPVDQPFAFSLQTVEKDGYA